MIQSGLRIGGVDAFVEGPSPSRHGASRVVGLLRASLLGGTALALLIGAGSGAWAQSPSQSQSVAGGLASGENSLAVGTGSVASSTSGVAVGITAIARGSLATAVGAGAIASADYSTAIGDLAYTIGLASTAVGMGSNALGNGATAVGRWATAGVFGDSTVIRGTALGVNSKASASNATALGYNAAAVTDSSIALGVNSVAGALSSLLGQDLPIPAIRAVAIGPGASALGSSSVALGDGAYVASVAGSSIAIGPNASVQASYSVALGADSITQAGFVSPGVQFSSSSRKIYTFAGVDQTIIDDNINAIGVVSVGGKQLDRGGYATRQIQFVAPGRLNADSTDAVNGSQLDATNTALSRILGSNYGKTTAEGIEAGSSLALGVGSVAGVSENPPTTDFFATAVGVASKATATYTTALGHSSTATETYATALGVLSKASAIYSTALGASSQATGRGSTALGSNSSASMQGAIALGLSSTASDWYASSIGSNSQAKSAGATAVGAVSHAGGVASMALGYVSEALGNNAVAIGPYSIASREGSVALGSGAQARVANSVALGAGSSVTGTANVSGSVVLGGVSYAFSGAATASTPIVSVGGYVLDDTGTPTTEYVARQIQNVAAGALSATSKDAVNGSQLWQVKEAMGAVVTADGQVSVGKFETGGTITARKIQNVADGALSATSTDGVNGSQLYATNQAVIATDAKIGAVVSGSDVSVADRTTGVARKLLGVANGALTATSTDGVNGSQLYATNQAVIATDAKIGAVVSGSGVSVADRVTGDARKILGVANGALSATSTDGVNGSQLYATNQAVIATDAKIGAVVSGSGVSVADRVTGDARKILGVADGALDATSKDAVNGSQLNATNARIDNFYANNVAIGSASTTGTAHDSSSITIGGVKYDFQAAASAASTNVFSVGAVGAERQIQNVAAGLLSATSTDAVNGSQLWQVKEAMGAVVTADGQVSVGKFETGGTITARKIQNVAAGALSATSTDGVNGSQLYATNQAVIATDAKIGAVVSGSDVSVADRTTGVARKLLGVANGALTATSTDAVNGSQLYATNQVLNKAVGDIAAVTGRVDVAEQNIKEVTTRVGVAEDNIKTLDAGIKSVNTRIDSFTGDPSGAQSLALGATSVASQTLSAALGYGAKASTANSVALGANSTTVDANASTGVQLAGVNYAFAGAAPNGVVSLGGKQADNSVLTRQIQNVAAGQVNATSTDAVNGSQLYVAYQAIGRLDTTLTGVTNRLGAETGASSSAYGAGSKASADYASAVGVNAAASASNATAIGYNAQASTANSVALGTNSTTTTATPVAGGVVGGQSVVYAGGSPVGVVSVGSVSGERQIQNVAAGQVTRASTDAVNGSQLFATNQAIDRTNQVVATLGQSLDALAVGVNQLSNRVGVVQKEARGGIAAAVALVNAPMPSQPGKTSWAGNVAKFRDQYAMGVSFSHRLNSNIPLAMTAGFAYTPGTSDVTGRFGMAGEF